mmetsp:Transcript_3778/g.5864  ORF Transcript_3778/g.5864 Transcript_3778/m.5864 type:complete len:872 (+) Transcript_3778:121-2736(+)
MELNERTHLLHTSSSYTGNEDYISEIESGCSSPLNGYGIHMNIHQDDYEQWGGTPGLRQYWNKQESKNIDFQIISDNDCNRIEEIKSNSCYNWLYATIYGTPGLLIATLLNLFLSLSFGQAFFPSDWEFPEEVPRSIGIQMFLFSTVICQLVMTIQSEFPCAMGMMMVENIPFMHTIAQIVISYQGQGIESFSTVLVAFALSSILVGVFFYILGALKLGNSVYFFPRHVIVGCIGGVGVFVMQTGLEVSVGRPWTWTRQAVSAFSSPSLYPLWVSSLGCELLLRALMALFRLPLLPPFYFVLIPPVFYGVIFALGIPVESMHRDGWFFESSEPTDFQLMWTLIDFETVQWGVIVKLVPTMIALTVFSLMHVPINIPSLGISTKINADMNKELKAHGISNILSGIGGGLQNYLCYSNSLLYFKCNGGGRISGLLLTLLTGVFFFVGPSIVHFVPRCMAGCLLIHVGIDLFSEAVFDSYGAFDIFEYGSILIITATMTAYGMTAGLGAGVVLAALTFTSQMSKHTAPLRGQMSALTVRSNARRSREMSALLDVYSKRIHIMQLQGNLFFGNATTLSEEIVQKLQESNGGIWCLILDFTLVLGIDSSAVETIASLPLICKRHGVKVCFARGSNIGFPCEAALSDRLEKGHSELSSHARSPIKSAYSITIPGNTTLSVSYVDPSTPVHISNDLNAALKWCENQVTIRVAPHLNPIDPLRDRPHIRSKPPELHQLYFLCTRDEEVDIDRLMSYFSPENTYPAGSTLWHQGESSTSAILIVEGIVISILEDEAGTTEEIGCGHLLGEYGLINNKPRASTLVAKVDTTVMTLRKREFKLMEKKDARLAYMLSKLCMGFLEYRVRHVANRIWESRCVPI